MIKHLLVDKETFPGFEAANELQCDECISGFSKINLLVGPNNSGKSRFLRNLLLAENLKAVLNFSDAPKEHFRELNDVLESMRQTLISSDPDPTGDTLTQVARSLQLSLTDTDFDQRHCRLSDYFLDFLRNECRSLGRLIFTDPERVAMQVRSERDKIHVDGEQFSRFVKWKRLYVPTLRTIRRQSNPTKGSGPLHEMTATHYGFKDERKIFTGEEIFQRIQSLLLGPRNERRLVRDFENFLSRAFFEGQEIELIPRSGANQDLHVRIGNAAEREIYSLGDGIQAIISIMFPLITKARDRNEFYLVGIEEPEQNLHPGFQRLLLRALSEVTDAQFFLTTHSNHLVDCALEQTEVALFKFNAILDSSSNEDQQHIIRVQSCNPRERRVIEDLGVRASSVLLANTTVWVEGISDRRIYEHYLNLYQATRGRIFLRDLHYNFIEYGGANVVHLDFGEAGNEREDLISVESISFNSLLIVDDDNATGKKRERLNNFSKELGGRFIKLNVREVENLVSPLVLSRILSEWEGRDFFEGDFPSDYSKEKLGEVLTKVVGSSAKRKYSSDGVLMRKTEFALAVIRHTSALSDLTPEAMRVIQEIYGFIERGNQ